MSWVVVAASLAVGAALASIWHARGAARLRARSDAASRQAREFKAMVENTNDAVLLMEAGRIVECNPAAERLFDASRTELLGAHPASLSPELQPGGGRSEDLANANIARAMARCPTLFVGTPAPWWTVVHGRGRPGARVSG